MRLRGGQVIATSGLPVLIWLVDVDVVYCCLYAALPAGSPAPISLAGVALAFISAKVAGTIHKPPQAALAQ